MAIVYEKDLINRKISIGQTVIGSLTSRTNTVDSYLLPLSKQTLVNVKFSVEQTVTEFDYFYLHTPLGYFSVKPGFKKIPNEGITFLMSYDAYNSSWYSDFSVIGSDRGVFRDTYTLEITEAPLPKFGLYVEGDETNLSANNIIRGFTSFYSWDNIKVTTPILPKGVTGTLVIYLADAGTFGVQRDKILKMNINISNEGERRIGSFDLAAKDYKVISNLSVGDYYLMILGGEQSSDVFSSVPPREYTLHTMFYSVFTEKQSVAINSTYNDHFTGWAVGLDTVVYNEQSTNFTISSLYGQVVETIGFVVKNKANAEVDTLSHVERIKFADTAIALDISGVGGQAYRVYKAAFNRTPDLGGLGFWISGMDGGETLNAVAQGFVNSAEFKVVYGANPTNAQIVTRFYDNVLGRAAESGGYNYWLGILDSGNANVAQVLASFSESPENQAALIGVIGNGFPYTPYG